MSRSQRLLELIQILRSHQYPVAGSVLASKLGISLRTLYRDIATLQAQGASIEGESGVGYILRPGFLLPPLMFSEDEIEALVLGIRWVVKRSDNRLADAAQDVLTKISAVLPPNLKEELYSSGMLIGPGEVVDHTIDLSVLRKAIRLERKIDINYIDLAGEESSRTVWPIALAFFDRVRILVAWCELRQGFRHFRGDGIKSLVMTDGRYPKRRLILLKEWRAVERIS